MLENKLFMVLVYTIVSFQSLNPSLMLGGSEREELLKGLEIMERTRQWFVSRLEQLSLEKSPKKVSSDSLNSKTCIKRPRVWAKTLYRGGVYSIIIS